MAENCCTTTAEGNSFCVLPAPAEGATCGCSSPAKGDLQIAVPPLPGLWQKIRGGVMFGLVCLTSPCCTPLIVPLGLALLAGTPAAVWLSAHLGWVYGGLTGLSVLSFVLAFWWGQKTIVKRPTVTTHEILLQPISDKTAIGDTIR